MFSANPALHEQRDRGKIAPLGGKTNESSRRPYDILGRFDDSTRTWCKTAFGA
jgi:hypothetical protein